LRTLREALRPGDLFVSLWLGSELIVIVGDRSDIHDVRRADAAEVQAKAAEFLAQVSTNPDRFVRGVQIGEAGAAESLAEILDAIVQMTLPRSAIDAGRGSHDRLLFFPDGILAGVPLHLGVFTGADGDYPGGIVYAPSASAFVACAHKSTSGPPMYAGVLLGDPDDEHIGAEARAVAEALPCQVSLIRCQDELAAISHPLDLLYVASHGSAEASDEDDWALEFDGSELTARDIYRGRLPIAAGALAVISACELGHVVPGPAHELQGFARALFYAGCANVIAARWPVLHEFASSVFGSTVAAAAGGMAPARALHESVWHAHADPSLRAFIANHDDEPFFWGPFVALGSG
jgi:hypothetical protein